MVFALWWSSVLRNVAIKVTQCHNQTTSTSPIFASSNVLLWLPQIWLLLAIVPSCHRSPLRLSLSISLQWRVPAHLSACCVLPACLWHLQHEYAFKVGWRVRFTCHSLTCCLQPPSIPTYKSKTQALPVHWRRLLPNGSRVLAIWQLPKVSIEWITHSNFALKNSCNLRKLHFDSRSFYSYS